MKTSILSMVLVIFASALAQAADSGACYAINDPDARAYCAARERHDPSICYRIQNADLRSMCFAEARK